MIGRGLAGRAAIGAIIALALVTLVMWTKWTLPRVRQDQLLRFCWTVLVPAALVQLAIVGVVLPWL